MKGKKAFVYARGEGGKTFPGTLTLSFLPFAGWREKLENYLTCCPWTTNQATLVG